MVGTQRDCGPVGQVQLTSSQRASSDEAEQSDASNVAGRNKQQLQILTVE